MHARCRPALKPDLELQPLCAVRERQDAAREHGLRRDSIGAHNVNDEWQDAAARPAPETAGV